MVCEYTWLLWNVDRSSLFVSSSKCRTNMRTNQILANLSVPALVGLVLAAMDFNMFDMFLRTIVLECFCLCECKSVCFVRVVIVLFGPSLGPEMELLGFRSHMELCSRASSNVYLYFVNRPSRHADPPTSNPSSARIIVCNVSDPSSVCVCF